MINITTFPQITKIYLVTNCYGDPNKVYIGKTIGSRKSRHLKYFGKNIFYNYIDKVESLKKEDWEPLESFWIEQFRQWGFDLQNIRMKGGSGPNFHTEETKDKIIKSKLNKGIKSIVQYDLEGNFIREWPSIRSAAFEFDNSKCGIISRCCRKEISKALGYVWRFKNDPLIGKYIPPINKHSKHVLQYDLEGNFIQKWDSATRAHLFYNNVTITTIINCCKGKLKSSGKYQWRFKTDNYPLKINKIVKTTHTYKPIIQLNKDGSFIKEWPNIREAMLFLNKKSNGDISNCCNGNNKTAYGYIWKFK